MSLNPLGPQHLGFLQKCLQYFLTLTTGLACQPSFAKNLTSDGAQRVKIIEVSDRGLPVNPITQIFRLALGVQYEFNPTLNEIDSPIRFLDENHREIEDVTLHELTTYYIEKGLVYYDKNKSSVPTIRDEEYLERVRGQSNPLAKEVVTVVSADWCFYCKPAIGYLAELAKTNPNIKIQVLDLRDSSPEHSPSLVYLNSQNYRASVSNVPQILLQTASGEPASTAETTEFLRHRVDQKIKGASPLAYQSMDSADQSLQYRELIGAVMITSVGLDPTNWELNWLKKYKPAGVLIYRDNDEPTLPGGKIQSTINKIKDVLGDDAIVAADQEGGLVQRLTSESTCILPPAKNLMGKSKEQIQRYASILARDLSELGVNMNFGPVLDLTDSRNIDISRRGRTFSDDPKEVIRIASIIVEELKRHGVYPVLKHFPGIGWTKDTHSELARLEANSTCDFCAREPFDKLLHDFQDVGIMLGHIIISKYDDKRPIAFSKNFIETALHKELHHSGIIVNDGFHMGGSRKVIPEVEAPYEALMAGVAPIFVNSVSLYASIRYIEKQMKDPILRPKIQRALVEAYSRVRKSKGWIQQHDIQIPFPQRDVHLYSAT